MVTVVRETSGGVGGCVDVGGDGRVEGKRCVVLRVCSVWKGGKCVMR